MSLCRDRLVLCGELCCYPYWRYNGSLFGSDYIGLVIAGSLGLGVGSGAFQLLVFWIICLLVFMYRGMSRGECFMEFKGMCARVGA